MSDPFIRYDCRTLDVPERFVDDEAGIDVELAPGAIVCDVYTNDNHERGTGDDPESWRTFAKDRAAFDRIVGRSRQGVGMRCDVELDGRRI